MKCSMKTDLFVRKTNHFETVDLEKNNKNKLNSTEIEIGGIR